MSTTAVETNHEQKAAAAPAQSLVPAQPRQGIRVVEDTGPLAHLFDTARFEHMIRIARVMAQASLIPDHMTIGKGKQFLSEQEILSNCFLVVNQAVRWGMDPFAVVPETYVVSGKLGFQGKLVAAVVNARAGLKERLNYEFSGTGDARTVTISATFVNETEPRTVTLSVAQAKTDNKMWAKDPDQKLIYSGATKWARRHCPEIMLGVLTDDDVDAMAAAQAHLPRAASLDDLAKRLTGEASTVPASEPTVTAGTEKPFPVQQAPPPKSQTDIGPNEPPLQLLGRLLRACADLNEWSHVYNAWCGPESTLNAADCDKAEKMCQDRRAELQPKRGGKTKGELFEETKTLSQQVGD